ncbi:MAG: hypothetical protein SPL21_07225 [Fibrobacter sp.]|nr:hypothetical protein [Fibrobacter sp.]
MGRADASAAGFALVACLYEFEGILVHKSKCSNIAFASDSKSSSTSTALSFADLCKASGGTAKDGICVCKETFCDEGVLCNTKSKECANKDAVEIECDGSYKSTCSNNPASIGVIKECQKGIIVNRSCGTVSCNEEGTDCGECLDDVQTCINKAYHTGGFMVVCSNGDLVDAVDGEEPNGDGIACNCEITTNNSEGCCYTRRTCFKQTNWATTNCRKPSGNENDD